MFWINHNYFFKFKIRHITYTKAASIYPGGTYAETFDGANATTKINTTGLPEWLKCLQYFLDR